MSSPLNELADALPQFLLQMQGMKQRQDAQNALSSYRHAQLAETIKRNELTRKAQEAAKVLGATARGQDRRADMLKLEDDRVGGAAAVYGPDQVATDFPRGIPVKREKEGKDPPEAGIVGRRIESDLKLLRTPSLLPHEVSDIKPRALENVRKYKSLTGRDYPADISALEPPVDPATFPTPVPPATLAGFGAPVSPAAPSVTPEGFPDPSTLPEGQPATFNGAPWIIRNGQWVKGQ